jgi:septum formation protein
MIYMKMSFLLKGVDTSTIHFRSIPEEVITSLIEEGQIFYCAGGLMIENPLMMPYIDRVDGSLDSVMGLSKDLLEKLMATLYEQSER